MRKSSLLSFVVISFCFGVACSKPGEQYFWSSRPVGSQNLYAIQYTTLGGVQKGKMVSRREDDETINGARYVKTVSIYSGIPGAEPDISYSRMTGKGIYCLSSKHRDQPEYLKVPFPVTVGTTWTTISPEGATDHKAESIETVYLFDRTYDKCLKLSSTGTTDGIHFDATDYIAPGIGSVKSVMRFGSVTIEFDLENYS